MKSIAFFFITYFVFSFTNIFAQLPIKYGSNPEAGKYVQVNDIKMYYETYGEGDPLLLVHWNCGSIASWENQIGYLAKKYKVIVCDSRAQGRSYDSDKEISYSLMASDYNELLNKLNLDSVYYFGWSDGGIIGIDMAMHYPSKIKKMVVIGANVTHDSTALYPALLKYIEDWAKTPFNKLSEEAQKSYTYLSPQPERAPLVKNKLSELMLKYPNYTARELSNINIPTLVMAGDHDLIREEHTLKIFQSIPNSQLMILPGTSHLGTMEKPELVNKTVDEFFSKPFKNVDCYYFLTKLPQ